MFFNHSPLGFSEVTRASTSWPEQIGRKSNSMYETLAFTTLSFAQVVGLIVWQIVFLLVLLGVMVSRMSQ